MSDLIEREDAIEAIHREARLAGGSVAIEYADMFQDAIKALPSADRPQGEWIPSDTDGFVCSVCKNGYRNQPTLMGRPMFEYCPVCGAQMKGADDE